MAASFSAAVTEVLADNATKAAARFNKKLVLAGGVAANGTLRKRLEKECKEKGVQLFMPDLRYCGDNAAMIAFAAWIAPSECQQPKNSTLEIRPAWELCKRIGI